MWKRIFQKFLKWLENIGIETHPPKDDMPIIKPPEHDNIENNSNEKIHCFMLAEGVCDIFLRQHYRSQLVNYRAHGFNTILTMADMETQARGFTRDYVSWGRDFSRPTNLLIENIGILQSIGLRVIIIGLNTWAARHNCTEHIGSIQKHGVKERDFYSPSGLEREKQFYKTLLSRFPNLYGIMPLLESQDSKAAGFVVSLSEYLRNDLKYKGKILLNGPRISATQRKQLNLWTAHSINNPDKWKTSQNDIRNSDGMYKLTRERKDIVEMIWNNPGKHGFILWSRDFIGHKSEPGHLYPEYCWK